MSQSKGRVGRPSNTVLKLKNRVNQATGAAVKKRETDTASREGSSATTSTSTSDRVMPKSVAGGLANSSDQLARLQLLLRTLGVSQRHVDTVRKSLMAAGKSLPVTAVKVSTVPNPLAPVISSQFPTG